tara:strand:- start:7893 stop:8237 length:345 start_codon:yes stop_codon:yes gene_type:complete
MASTLNFTHINGDTFDQVVFRIVIDAVNADLTDAIIRMQLRKKPCDLKAVLSLTSVANAGLTIIDAVEGLFAINEQVIDIDINNYAYDIEIEFGDGTIKTYIRGNFNILAEVTR